MKILKNSKKNFFFDFQKKCPGDGKCHKKCMVPHLDVILVQTAHKLVGFGPLWGVGGGSGSLGKVSSSQCSGGRSEWLEKI